MQRPLLGDKTLRNDTDKAVGERYDAFNRLIHLVRKAQVGSRGMNVTQAVMELKDTKDTFDQLVSFMKWVKSRIGGGPVRIAKGVSRPLRFASSLADCAKAYLWYKFGVEPTARDIAEFRRQVAAGRLRVKGSLQTKTRVAMKNEVVIERWSTARTKSDIAAAMYDMDELQTKGGYASGSGVQLGYRLPNGISRILLPLAGPAKGWRNAYRVISQSMRGCYFARVKEDIVIDGLDDLRRRFGWDCPALKTVWELIPFSFLVDWIVDVGSFIERLEKRYLYEDYSRYLGPIWGTEEYREDIYVPALQRFDTSFSDLVRPADTSYGGSLNLRWTWSAGVRRISSRTVFNRNVASTPSVLWPMLQKKIQAYQISTGMALLAQLGRELGRAK
jgi:hypothetical protein